MVIISEPLLKEIREHGEKEYPNECCGIMFGKIENGGTKSVTEILSISNARETENRHNRFLITSQEMMKAEFYARKKKLDIVGFYHSHPNHPAKPSGYDLEHAWPKYSYIIVSVEKKKSCRLTSWELEDDRTKFNEEEIKLY